MQGLDQLIQQSGSQSLLDLVTQHDANQLAQLAPVGLFIVDLDLNIRYMNNWWTDLTGQSQQSMIEQGWAKFVHPQDIGSALGDIPAPSEGESTEFRVWSKDGVYRWVNVRTKPLIDKSGEIVGRIGSISDISAGKKREEDLSQQAVLWSRAEEVAAVGHWRLDPKIFECVLSAGGNRICRIDRPDATMNFKNFLRLHHTDDRNHVEKTVMRAINQKERFTVEVRLALPNGEIRHIRNRGECELNEQGDVEALFGVLQDITDRKIAEETAERERSRLAHIASGVPDVLYQVILKPGQRPRFIYVSDVIQDLYFGLTPEDVLADAANMDALIHPDDLDHVHQKMEQSASTLGNWICDYRILSGGRTKWIRGASRPIRSADGAIMWNGILSDVTEEKEAEAILRRTKEEAEIANRAKSEFLAMMSHEIRTPMNGIVGMTSLLLASDLSSKQRDFVETAQESADGLLTIIDDILTYSKLEAGRIELDAVDFDLIDTVEHVTSILAAKAADKSIDLLTDIPASLPATLVGDPGRVRQVLYNLIGNAIKFTKRGNVSVAISHKPVADGQVEIRFAVSDTGIGIADADQSKLFGRFTQADSSISRRFGGTGLGLSISKQLAELMNGRITVKSELGIGSEFCFELKCAVGDPKAARKPANKPAELNAQPDTTLRLLVAEDHAVNQTVIRAILSQFDYNVDVVDNGVEAVRAVRNNNYDVVLMDIQMPDMDGVTATKVIRLLDAPQRNVPIVALTAHAMEGDREKYLAAGLNGYVTKPIDVRHLLSTIEILTNSAPVVADGHDLSLNTADDAASADDSDELDLLIASIGD